MELHLRKVREEFIDHIVALQNPDEIVVPREFIKTFLDVIFPDEQYLKSIPDRHFPVEANAATAVLNIPVENLRKIVLRTPSDKRKTPLRSSEFRKGIDYITVERHRIENGGVVHPLFMTVSCFQRACMQMRGQVGIRTRYYFDLIARSYYDYMGEDIWERLKVEDPFVTLQKKQHPKYYKSSAHPVSYDFLFGPKERKFVYTGVTDDINIRMQKHTRTKPWIPEELTTRDDVNPLFDETCRTLLYAPYAVATPEGYRGTKSIFIHDRSRWNETKEFCAEKQKQRSKNGVSKGYCRQNVRFLVL